ncbi:MAG: molecular chaperone TorD family protein [Cellulomonas sp.]|uniref:TorD/DmsD family molecular chaperone n=1 Tax=Cellulomonas sp. TaxID=40001 RepID=UPI0017CB6AA9|nr:molecular chaperone TorD family protein [Cellulomonas sp.]NMM18328.1 molecular chaperone TorD family protein [Cellulomonas sp.]NMM29899.1 molecular chaperone TorD family protein [Cellulomonas sp.]
MTTTAEPTDPSASEADEQLGLLMADREALGVTLDRFAAVFTVLASLLGEAPEAELVDRVRAADQLAQWPVTDDGESLHGRALLEESAQAHEDATAVRRDYNRLFFGPDRMIAPPYESVHRSEEHLVFERDTMLVRAAYAEFGLAAPRLNKEPDDHIGLEVNFLATLCVRGMDALDDADDAELAHVLRGIRSFLADHVLAWAPTCLTQAAQGATTHFYQGVAALGLGALAAAQDAFLRAP